ncbi:MAG: glucosyl transferase, partial [Ignavibacterium sp.]
MKPLSFMPLLILIIQTLLFTTGCKQSTEPKLEAELKLELEDASCTEAWIKLSATNLQSPATINLLKDGNVAQTISLWRDADTVLYVDSLLPNQTYRFKTIVQSSNQQINTS